MSLVLAFDTETTRFVNRNLPHDHRHQARLVQLGAVLVERDPPHEERASLSLIARPDGWTVPPDAAAVHGISQDVAERCGVEAEIIVHAFARLLDRADEAIAFNFPFDRDVVSIELLHLGLDRPVDWPTDVRLTCAMEAARAHMRLPPTERMVRAGRLGYKAPKLGDAYAYLFGEPLVDAHDALVDARATARVWFEILRREGAGG